VPAGPGPHSSWSARRSRGRFGESSHEPIRSRCRRGGTISSPTPAADFPPPNLASNLISIAQDAASSAVHVSVNQLNGFSGAVQVALDALPAGVASNPVSPFTVAATGGATLTIRGSGFQRATALTINGKAATATFKGANTLLLVTPSPTPGPLQITITNSDGETVSVDAAFVANGVASSLLHFSGCFLTFFAICSSNLGRV
jgi:IPT/TIG domain